MFVSASGEKTRSSQLASKIYIFDFFLSSVVLVISCPRTAYRVAPTESPETRYSITFEMYAVINSIYSVMKQ